MQIGSVKPIIEAIKKQFNLKDAEEFELTQDNKVRAYTEVFKHYSSKSWYLKEKQNSCTLGELYKVANILIQNKFSIDLAIKFILAAFFVSNYTSLYFRLPDRFLARRLGISRNRVELLAFLLSKTNLIILKREYGRTYIKLNLNIIKKDKYLEKKRSNLEFNRVNITVLDECIQKNNSIYYEDYSILEIANLLHVNAATIRTRLCRGRKILKKLILEDI